MDLYPLLEVNRTASGAVSPYRVVVPSGDGQVAQASAATDALSGVAGQLGADPGDRIDIHYAGIVPVEYGGAVAVGDRLTADANGRAIKATAGTNVIGIAQEAGSTGVFGSLLIAPGALAPEPPETPPDGP